MKMLKPDGSLNNEAIYARYFGDYKDMVACVLSRVLGGCSLVFTSG